MNGEFFLFLERRRRKVGLAGMVARTEIEETNASEVPEQIYCQNLDCY